MGRAFADEWGSSPRVRGKRAIGEQGSSEQGLIPACAGKTVGNLTADPELRAHPRVCGENRVGCFTRPGVPGSSPRVRGKLSHGENAVCLFGLIPACAGKTPFHGSGRGSVGAHPRVCGENADKHSPTLLHGGSSPRVRGKHLAPAMERIAPGLIPACAGKTEVDPVTSTPPRAHPRVCGENSASTSGRNLPLGSSPRVRGKRGCCVVNE